MTERNTNNQAQRATDQATVSRESGSANTQEPQGTLPREIPASVQSWSHAPIPPPEEPIPQLSRPKSPRMEQVFTKTYDMGRLLASLDFHMQQAVLDPKLPNKNAMRTDQIFQELSMLARDVLLRASPDAAQEFIGANLETWVACFRSEWRALDYWAAVEFLEPALGSVDDFEALRQVKCLELLEPFLRLMKHTRAVIAAHLASGCSYLADDGSARADDFCERILHLGECVQRGLCPARIYLYMNGKFVPKIRETLPAGYSPFAVAMESSRQSRVNYLAENFFAPGELPLQEPWTVEVAKRSAEIGLPIPSMAVPTSPGEAADTDPQKIVDDRLSFVEGIHRAARAYLAELEDKNNRLKSAKKGYLGIVLDEAAHVVRRGDKEVKIGSQGRLWVILCKLVGARGCPREAYDLMPIDASPEINTVRGYVSDLRKVLKKLGLGIPNERNLGYRLVEI